MAIEAVTVESQMSFSTQIIKRVLTNICSIVESELSRMNKRTFMRVSIRRRNPHGCGSAHSETRYLATAPGENTGSRTNAHNVFQIRYARSREMFRWTSLRYNQMCGGASS